MICKSCKAAGFAQSGTLPNSTLFSIVQLEVWG